MTSKWYESIKGESQTLKLIPVSNGEWHWRLAWRLEHDLGLASKEDGATKTDFSDGLDDLLALTSNLEEENSKEEAGKCSVVYLGGSQAKVGKYPRLSRTAYLRKTIHLFRCCNKLMCSECDLMIVIFNDFRWRQSADYLFLRNNYPDKLQAGLTKVDINK